MEKINLDCRHMSDKQTAHLLLQEKLHLPAYYGHNLDALWDSLTTDFSEKMIILEEPQLLVKQLGRYGTALKKVFEEAAAENKYIKILYWYNLDKNRSEPNEAPSR